MSYFPTMKNQQSLLYTISIIIFNIVFGISVNAQSPSIERVVFNDTTSELHINWFTMHRDFTFPNPRLTGIYSDSSSKLLDTCKITYQVLNGGCLYTKARMPSCVNNTDNNMWIVCYKSGLNRIIGFYINETGDTLQTTDTLNLHVHDGAQIYGPDPNIYLGVPFKYVISFGDNYQPSNTEFTWKSKDTSIAKISNDGVATAMSLGTTLIEISRRDLIIDTQRVHVKNNNLITLEILKKERIISIGDTIDYNLLGKFSSDPESWKNIPSGLGNWSSSNNVVQSLSKGSFKGMKAGLTTITIKYQTKETSIQLQVVDSIYGLKLPKPVTLIYDTIPLQYNSSNFSLNMNPQWIYLQNDTLKTLPVNDSCGITYSSSGACRQGYVDACSDDCHYYCLTCTNQTSGIAEIGASFIGYTSDPAFIVLATETIEAPLDSNVILHDTLELVPKSGDLKLNHLTSWKSSDTTVASVDSIGRVIGKECGRATIYMQLDHWADSLVIQVTNKVARISLTPSDTILLETFQLQYQAIALFQDGSTKKFTDSINWSLSNKDVARINSNGLLTSETVGTTNIVVNFKDCTDTAKIHIIGPIEDVKISPQNKVFQIDNSLNYQLQLESKNGHSYTFTRFTKWSVLNPEIATIDSNGFLTTKGVGSTYIIAQMGPLKDSTLLHVINPLDQIIVSPSDTVLYRKQNLQYKAIGIYNNGDTADISDHVEWVNINPQVFSLDSNGYGTGISIGDYHVQAITNSDPGRERGVRSALTHGRIRGDITRLMIRGVDSKNILVRKTMQLTLIAFDYNGKEAPYTKKIKWTSSDTSRAIVDDQGKVLALDTGLVYIEAAINDTASTNIFFFVVNPLEKIEITPRDSFLLEGKQLQFKAIGTYYDSSTNDISNTVKWESSQTQIATIDASGLLKSDTTGTTKITASFNKIFDFVTDSTILTVFNPLISISINPKDTTIIRNKKINFRLTALYQNGSKEVLTSSIKWSVKNSLYGSIKQSGEYTSFRSGKDSIIAVYKGNRIATAVSIVNPLDFIQLLPQDTTILMESTVNYTAIAVYADGQHETITNLINLTITDSLKSSISFNGRIQFNATGKGSLTATYKGKSVSSKIKVINPLKHIQIQPLDTTIIKKDSLTYALEATYEVGPIKNVAAEASWKLSNQNLVSISEGELIALDTGKLEVIAIFNGKIDSSSLHITNNIASIGITPSDILVTKGTSFQYKAYAIYQDGSRKRLKHNLVWGVTNPAIAQINITTGKVSTLSKGKVYITVNYKGINAVQLPLNVE